ncbi:MAG: ATP-binding protein [archaeon]
MNNFDMNVFKEDILNTIRDSIVVLDKDLNVIFANDSFYKQFKASPDKTINAKIYKLGNGQWDIPELRKLLEEMLPKKTSIKEYKVEHEFPLLGQRTMLLNAKELKDGTRAEKYILMVIEDATEKAKLLEASLHANRLAMIGQLSAGIAHGLSSPLTGLHNYIDVYLKEEPADSVRHEEFKLMLEACEYMNRIVKDLTYFSSGSKGAFSKIKIEEVISSTLMFTERQFASSNITITPDISSDIKAILGNKCQLQHVLLNVLLNAKESMPKGGNILIKARNSENKGLILEIEDKGIGIPKENLIHVFEPFYTTKKKQGGAGLGLSASAGIIMNHNGTMYIESEVGKGTRIIIKLPFAE